MLKQLRIHNIILVDTAEISFETGFNVLSGETGAGKSALMKSLGLVLGDRADSSFLRHGAEKASVEASFAIENIPEALALLQEAGIDHSSDEDLIIRREMGAPGKSNSKNRCFLNHQMAHLSLIQKLAPLLIDIVGQHANQRLLSVDYHRQVLDAFGGLQKSLRTVREAWSRENSLRKRLQHLLSSEAQRLREIEVCRLEAEELEKARLKEGEDDELFQEYQRCSHFEELFTKTNEIAEGLSGGKNSFLMQLNRYKGQLEHLSSLDPALSRVAQSLKSATLEFEEVYHDLRSYKSHLNHDPEKLTQISDRLSHITQLKRKYGSSLQEIHAYLQKTKERLKSLLEADIQIDELRKELSEAENHTNVACATLTQERQAAAKGLSKAVEKEIHSLNMPKALFKAVISKQTRSALGDDLVEFYLQPNVGEPAVPVKNCASGGELARVMLALKLILAGKDNIPSLVFDEIDANIGGETATILGEKLNGAGGHCQVICITHLPQVARRAHHHFCISKREVEGRTLASIDKLTQKGRLKEISRMLGGTQTTHNKIFTTELTESTEKRNR